MLWRYIAIGLISAATLILQITLTRIFSVAQWYHFAFLSVSVALLGFGASGSILSVRPPSRTRGKADYLTEMSLGFALSTIGSYLAINYLPFDSFRIAWERVQLLYLALYYLALVMPFFFGGLMIGSLLQVEPEHVGLLYGINMGGSALGCLAALGLLPLLGGGGTIALVAALGAASALLLQVSGRPWLADRSGRVWRGLCLGLLLLLIALAIRPPAWWDIGMSPYKTLSAALRFPNARILHRRWNAISRVDVIESEGIHSAPGLSLVYRGVLPPQLGLTLDGGNLSPITRRASSEDEEFLDYLPASLAYELRPASRCLVISPGGGLDVLTALHHDVSSVTVVEGNPAIVEVMRERYGEYAGHIYRDARVRVIIEDGRSFVRRSEEHFDILHLSLTDTYHPITSGAFGLSESYAYTLEAFEDYLGHLSEDGILMLTRWLQDPPSEELRVCALAVEALEHLGVPDPRRHIVAIRSWSTATLLVRRTPFTVGDIENVIAFCDRLNYDLIYYPGMTGEEANRYNLLEAPVYYESFSRVITPVDHADFYQQYDYEISPPSDDRPFFFHFFKWSQVPDILRNYGKTWQPFGGSGYLVLIMLLILALAASGVLILLPLALGRERGVRFRGRFLLYFALLGIGYLWIEIPLMQRFILFLGQPTYAFGVVLFALLLASGIGSVLSTRINGIAALLALVALALLYPLALPWLFERTLGLPLAARVVITVLSVAPLGMLMGIPFPKGIAIVGHEAPELIPWVWGVNGCASVISSILSMILSISFGFSTVLLLASATYAMALIVIYPLWGKELGSQDV
ncbi:MAG: hypothetical protein ABIK79_15775 [Chloroflexota bacterium]